MIHFKTKLHLSVCSLLRETKTKQKYTIVYLCFLCKNQLTQLTAASFGLEYYFIRQQTTQVDCNSLFICN